MAHHIDTGREGEALAAAYLARAGYKILARNVSNPSGKRLGEIDIVAQKRRGIVFVEVKTLFERGDGDEWLPEWQVSPAKLRKLERIAEYFLKREKLTDRDTRFDVMAITLSPVKPPKIKHIEHAFL